MQCSVLRNPKHFTQILTFHLGTLGFKVLKQLIFQIKAHEVYIIKMVKEAGLKNSSDLFKIFQNMRTPLPWVNFISSELSSNSQSELSDQDFFFLKLWFFWVWFGFLLRVFAGGSVWFFCHEEHQIKICACIADHNSF